MGYEEKTITTRNDEPNSIEVTLNAKGLYQWSVKAYGNGASFEELIRQIKAADIQLRRLFPAPVAEGSSISYRQQGETPPGPKAPARHGAEEPKQREKRPLAETKEEGTPPEAAPPAGKRRRKAELVDVARKPFSPVEEEEEIEEPAPTFRRRNLK